MAQKVYLVGIDRSKKDEHSFWELEELLKKGYKVISSESILRECNSWGSRASSITGCIAYILEEPTEK